MTTELTIARLRELLHYDPLSGIFTWKVYRGNRIRVGDPAGCKDSFGHRQIRIDGKLYLAHRLAWFYTTGSWPADELDHIDGDPDANQINNLREATRSTNPYNLKLKSNNKSGHAGVHWYASKNKWQAKIRCNNKQIHLGLYTTLEEAVEARKKAEIFYFGEFRRLA